MAVSNYSLAYAHSPSPFVTIAPSVINSQLDDLLYPPELQQNAAPEARNEPFADPRRNKLKKRGGSHYLPPQNQFTQYPREQTYLHTQLYNNPRLSGDANQSPVMEVNSNYQANAGQYVHDPSGDYDSSVVHPRPNHLHPPRTPPQPAPDYSQYRQFEQFQPQVPYSFQDQSKPQEPHGVGGAPQQAPKRRPAPPRSQPAPRADAPVERPPGFTKVEASSGGSNTKTQIHAVLDYDEDYYDDIPGDGGLNLVQQKVTPLQGPILVKNGSVPVVPLFSYPKVNNGTYYQIPIFWTALSLALGYELQGQVIKGVPCVKRNYQLYCPTAGNTYPLEKIESFIDENKALMRRMYGAFGGGAGAAGAARRRRGTGEVPGVPDPEPHRDGDSFFRHARQANSPPPLTPSQTNGTNRLDACESKTEIITPYWALNSARKLRAVVNTMHFEQAIHQEVCSKTTTARCAGDCGCEQKYKWHRLLAYDPDEDCNGIFMDWFLFPSCCVCRCNP